MHLPRFLLFLFRSVTQNVFVKLVLFFFFFNELETLGEKKVMYSSFVISYDDETIFSIMFYFYLPWNLSSGLFSMKVTLQASKEA